MSTSKPLPYDSPEVPRFVALDSVAFNRCAKSFVLIIIVIMMMIKVIACLVWCRGSDTATPKRKKAVLKVTGENRFQYICVPKVYGNNSL